MTDRFAAVGHRVWVTFALATLLGACKSDDLAAPVSSARTNAAHASNDVFDQPVKRLTSRFAYLWAHDPHAASYAPLPQYSYNASGGAIQITRRGTGFYEVTIDGIVDSADHRVGLSVVAYGATTIVCSLNGLPVISGNQFSNMVSCWDPVAYTYTDAQFSMLAIGYGSLLPRAAAAWPEGGDWPEYTLDSAHGFNTGPDSMTVTYNGIWGDENVEFGTGPIAGTTALVTPVSVLTVDYSHYLFPTCQLGGWISTGVHVRCFDKMAEPWSERYHVIQLERGRIGRRFGFAYAHQQSTASYAPSPGHSYNSSGGGIMVTRTAVGRYIVDFAGLQKLAGHSENVQVTAFSGDVPATCNVVQWGNSGSATSLQVSVECRRVDTGAYRDLKFNVVVIE